MSKLLVRVVPARDRRVPDDLYVVSLVERGLVDFKWFESTWYCPMYLQASFSIFVKCGH